MGVVTQMPIEEPLRKTRFQPKELLTLGNNKSPLREVDFPRSRGCSVRLSAALVDESERLWTRHISALQPIETEASVSDHRPDRPVQPKFRNLGIVLVLVVVLVLGALAFCAGKDPLFVLQLFCSVSPIVKHSDSRGRGRGRLLNFGV
jgi:hypothetical protein